MIPDQEENLKVLAEPCQLFTNIHHAISVHRKFKISAYLKAESKKVAEISTIDQYLFDRNFADLFKNEQAIKKASGEFKKYTRRFTIRDVTCLTKHSPIGL